MTVKETVAKVGEYVMDRMYRGEVASREELKQVEKEAKLYAKGTPLTELKWGWLIETALRD